jgi:Zn-dependent peptidase ImmA (M78 family)
MKIVKLGSRKIKVYFNDKKVDEYEKEGNKGYVHGFCDRGMDEVFIRKSLPPTNQRICLLHELGHLCFDFLRNLSDESLVEINARFIDELFIRNVWIRKLYEKEKK